MSGDSLNVTHVPQSSNNIADSYEVGMLKQGALAERINQIALPVITNFPKRPLWESFMRIFRTPQVVIKQRIAKAAERKAVYECYKIRFEKTLNILGMKDINSKVDRSESDLYYKFITGDIINRFGRSDKVTENTTVIDQKIERKIHQFCLARNVPCDNDQLKEISDQLRVLEGKIEPKDLFPFFTMLGLQSYGKDIKDLAQALSQELKPFYAPLSKQEKQCRELADHMMKIDQLIQSNRQEHFGKASREIMDEIRAALRTPAYQALKDDENHPCVRILHNLCTSGYLEAEVMPGYANFGSKLERLAAEHSDEKLVDQTQESLRGDEYVKGVSEFRLALHRAGAFVRDMTSFTYLIRYAKGAVGAFMSIFSSLPYDPRSALENNAGAFFEESATIDGEVAKTRHFFTPSWRIGTEVPPEAHAMLQSMTNRFYQREVMEQDPHPASQICYNNAQDFHHGTEGLSSQNIMKLNRQYPTAFFGCTITCDSHFHKRGATEGSGMFHNIYPEKGGQGLDAPKKMEDFAHLLKEELTHDDNFKIEGREGKTGYYFDAKTDDEKDLWKAHLTKCCDYLSEKYKGIQSEPPYLEIREKISIEEELSVEERQACWVMESAMIEEANLMIAVYNQARGLKVLKDAKMLLEQAMTSVCKELADRGKMRSILMMYSAMQDDEAGKIRSEDSFLARVMSETRPLMVRGRMGLEKRNKQGESLIQLRTPSNLRESMAYAMELCLKTVVYPLGLKEGVDEDEEEEHVEVILNPVDDFLSSISVRQP